MSKINIPTCKFNDDECNKLFTSITEKLNIHNPQFFYPIYKKVLDDTNMTSEELRGIVFDSKFKCKEILTKNLDCDSEDYETDNDTDPDVDKLTNDDNTQQPQPQPVFTFKDASNTNESVVDAEDDEDDEGGKGGNNIEHILNTKNDFDIENINGNIEEDTNSENSNGDDREIEEAINNTFTANALIERINKKTGESIIKEEEIHIKKTALLEPLKIMKDEFVIPARIQNKNLDNETLRNTMNKLNSYNNSGHVEALFLYLGNKLVESGKCPSFPYYYGCVNGEDPNYHHNITDEYEMVSRTKWFRNRVKNDFDLLIIENEDIDEMQEQLENNLRKPLSYSRNDRFSRNRKGNDDSDDEDSNGEDSNCEDSNCEDSNCEDSNCEDVENNDEEKSLSDDIEKDLENIENIEDIDNNIEKDLSNNHIKRSIIPIDAIDTALDSILDELENKDAVANNTNFISELNDDELDININDDDQQVGGNIITTLKDNKNETDNSCNGNVIDDDFIEELSDIDPEKLSLSEFENNTSNLYYVKCDRMPVNLCLMEKLDNTLDNLLDDGYNMSENEWFSVWFQVSFGLAIAQKYFNFVHNDLHSSNVMFKETVLKYIYFHIDNIFYKIPTYGKITKIIDFARGTFKLGDRWIFSDQFKDDGDACGQYDYPVDGNLKNCEHKPNSSFDLVRLGTTVIQRLDDVPAVMEFVESITKDDYDNSLCYDEDTFQLYIDIAHNCHNAVPIEVIRRNEFERFRISKEKVPKGIYVFKY
jgi:hypothetical protein